MSSDTVDRIHAVVRQVDPLSDHTAELEVDAVRAGRALESVVHVGVRLDRDQVGSGREVAQVRTDARSHFDDRLRQVGKGRRLPCVHVPVDEAAHEAEEARVEAAPDWVLVELLRCARGVGVDGLRCRRSTGVNGHSSSVPEVR